MNISSMMKGFLFYIKVFTSTICMIGMFYMLIGNRIIIPLNIVDNTKTKLIKQELKMLGVTNKDLNDYTRSVEIAAETTNIDERIIIYIGVSESQLNPKAVSSAGYRGIMQATKHDIYEFPEVDFMRGAKKLEYWLKYRGGDLEFALASYNGGVNPPKSSFVYAREIIQKVKNSNI